MARPTKWRHVCSLPDSNRFGPLDVEVDNEHFIVMRIDEYETIRLIDLEGFTQAECAEQMNVARTTVQAIYSRARRKLAKSLVNNKVLQIQGGEYKLCDGEGEGCGPGCQHHHQGRGMGQGRGQGRMQGQKHGRGPGLGRQINNTENED